MEISYSEDMKCTHEEFLNASDGDFFIHTHSFNKTHMFPSNWIVVQDQGKKYAYTQDHKGMTTFCPIGEGSWFNQRQSSQILKPGKYADKLIDILSRFYPDFTPTLPGPKILKRTLKLQVI